jgi:hypothetical protein
MRPEIVQMEFAAGAACIEQKKTAAFSEALGKVGEELGGYFADASLGLDDLRDRDKLAYSRISKTKR